MKINSVLVSHPLYPEALRHIPDAPKQLYYRGKLPEPDRLHVAIIGTRKPTAYGREVTQKIAEDLARRGAVIVSGLALGIDGIALESAVKAGGTTVAVLASGLDKVSPMTNRHIAEQMLACGGAIVGEFEPGTPPMQFRFLQRNRIVSGLSGIVIVTEASDRSGTMNTVASALSQGRDVYAVPGNLTSPMSRGCNRLISQGATPIVDIDEFLDQVLPMSSLQTLLFANTPEEDAVLSLLKSGVRDGEELHEKSGLEPHIFAETMTMLEIQGTVKPLGGNRWTL